MGCLNRKRSKFYKTDRGDGQLTNQFRGIALSVHCTECSRKELAQHPPNSGGGGGGMWTGLERAVEIRSQPFQ